MTSQVDGMHEKENKNTKPMADSRYRTFHGTGRLERADGRGLSWSASYVLGLNLLTVFGVHWCLRKRLIVQAIFLSIVLLALLVLPCLTVTHGSNMMRYRVPAMPCFVLFTAMGLRILVLKAHKNGVRIKTDRLQAVE